MTILDAIMGTLTVIGGMSFIMALILIAIEITEQKRLREKKRVKRNEAIARKELQDYRRISDKMKEDRQAYKNSLHQTVIVKGVLAEEYKRKVSGE